MLRIGSVHGIVVAAALIVVCAAGAWAQFNTANLPTAEPWQSEGTLATGEIRFFEGNQTYAASVRSGRAGQDMDVELSLFYMDTSGEEAVAGTVRDSEALLLGLNLKWLARREGNMTVSVIPGLEYPLDDMEGTNTDIPATATSDDIIPVLTIPVEWRLEDGTRLTVAPRYVGFDEAPEFAAGETIAGFGDVIAVAGSVVHPCRGYLLHGDLAVVLDGDNSINENTNQPTDELVWSAGATWLGEEGSDYTVTLFATNAAGPTAATSIIAAPGDSVAVGLRATNEF